MPLLQYSIICIIHAKFLFIFMFISNIYLTSCFLLQVLLKNSDTIYKCCFHYVSKRVCFLNQTPPLSNWKLICISITIICEKNYSAWKKQKCNQLMRPFLKHCSNYCTSFYTVWLLGMPCLGVQFDALPFYFSSQLRK